MKIVTAEEMRAIDRATTERYGVSSLTLMENAGSAVAEFALKHFEFNSACVVCGKGNNGGDGFVAARKLHEKGKQVFVIVLAAGADELRGDAAEMFKKLPVSAIWVSDEASLGKHGVQGALNSDLVVDAVLGTGFKPPLKGIAELAILAINKSTGCVLAVDVPSGVDSDSNEPPGEGSLYVQSGAIVSFTAVKPALVFGNLTEGPIAIGSIGSPAKAVNENSSLHEDVLTSRDVQAFSPPRKRDANKGNFGHVLVVGGSAGKSGAAAMAGLAALRTGAGLVTVACPRSVQPVIAAYAPELMTEPLAETNEGTISLLALANRDKWLPGKSVVVIGPGISRNEETAEFVRDLVSICPESLVLDADGLNAFEKYTNELPPDQDVSPLAARVLTPHPGEMSRLTGLPTDAIQRNRIAIAIKTAIETHCCVVLKGHRTVIASPEGYVWINCTGNPGMAKGGSGDVLSGIIAGVLAQWPHQKRGVQWRADWDESSEFADPEEQRLVRVVSKLDPEGHELKKLSEEFQKTQDPGLAAELKIKLQKKTQQVVTLLNCLAVGKAVFLHGLAGDIARDLHGENSMLATDIVNSIGEAYAACESEAHSKFAYLQR